MFERNNSLNISLSSFEDNNDFFPLNQLSSKDNSFFDDRLFSTPFLPDLFNSFFLGETQDINFLTKEIFKKPNITYPNQLLGTNINKNKIELEKVEKKTKGSSNTIYF